MMTGSKNYKIISPSNWIDYELIDSGNFEKLERFGNYILSRPEPQAIWEKSLSESNWEKKYNAKFILDIQNSNGEKGHWIKKKDMPDSWNINYNYKNLSIKFNIKFNSFKHIGIFPEQADNWNFIYDSIVKNYEKDYKVLNLFAYTGGATLAAKAAGANVYHVDSVKSVINWANENMLSNNLQDIHWVVEDAFKFVQREVKRKNIYNGIILDPPAFGRGPNGEKWILEKQLNQIICECSKLLKHKNSFFILNLYSLGLSPLISENIINNYFPDKDIETGEVFFSDNFSKKLPLGTFARFFV